MNMNYSQANLSTSSYSTQRLFKIVSQGDRDQLETFLSHNTFQQSDLNQALFLCISNYSTLSKQEECMVALLNKTRADPNCIINDKTPLISACNAGVQVLVRRLLQNGAKIDTKDSQGNLPLFYAISRKAENFDLIQLLINRMPNVNVEISKKTTAIAFAIRKQFQKTIKRLFERNINLHVDEDSGDTLLHTVCKQPYNDSAKKQKIIKLLLTKLNLNAKNKENKTAIEYLDSVEMKQFAIDCVKPKQKEQKARLILQEPEQEEIDNIADDFLQDSSPCTKKLVHITEESDEEKKQQKKDKATLKSKKSPITPVITRLKQHPKPAAISTCNQKFRVTKQANQKARPDKMQKKRSLKNGIVRPSNTFPNKERELIRETAKQSSKQQSKESLRQSAKLVRKESLKDAYKQPGSRQPKQQKQDLMQWQDQLTSGTIFKQLVSRNQKLLLEIKQIQRELLQPLPISPEAQYFYNQSKAVFLTKTQASYVLTKEIEQFVVEETQKCQPFPNINEQIINLIMGLFSKKLKDTKVKLDMYGSQSSGLSLSTSDLDLVLTCQYSPYEFLELIEAYNVLISPDIDQVKCIRASSIPIIKMRLGAKHAYRNVNITFQTYYHNGLKCNALLREYMGKDPHVRPLVLVLKKLLYVNQLHDTYTGGLGSYSLVLLVVAFLQCTKVNKKAENSLGLLLLQFLFYYGYELDYVGKSILVYSPHFSQFPIDNNVFQLPYTQDTCCKLVIHDPINPTNNVSRSTYRFRLVKQLFILAYNKLIYNRRCSQVQCKMRLAMSSEELKTLPCCLLKALFRPQTLMDPYVL